MIRKAILVPLRGINNFFTYVYLKLFSRGTFLFEGVALPYEYNFYNTTWLNERMIEAPIGQYIVQMQPHGAAILEVGNTLKYYYRYAGDVVDKYEVVPGVINADIADFNPGKQYDLILSLSTMEHVGFDEDIKDPGKISRSLVTLASHLKSGGKMVVTVPLGYNSSLDEDIKHNRLLFTRAIFMKRVGMRVWERADAPYWQEIYYGSPFPCANWIMIGIFEKS